MATARASAQVFRLGLGRATAFSTSAAWLPHFAHSCSVTG
jgi:hypothetical protein